MQLKPLGIGVTVLCPGFVRTRISGSGRNRPELYGPVRAPDPASAAGRLAAESASCKRPGSIRRKSATQTLAAIREDELYVFTHPEMHDEVSSGSPPSWRQWTKPRSVGRVLINRAAESAACSNVCLVL